MGRERRHVVVVAPNWLGDAVMSLPLLGMLSAAEGVDVSVLARPYVARVFTGLEGLHATLVSGGGSRLGRIAGNAKALRAAGADACVVLPPSFSGALAPFLARIPRRIGFVADARGALLTRAVTDTGGRRVHLSEQYRQLGRTALESLDVPVGGGTAPVPVVAPSDVGEARALTERMGIAGAYVVVVPGATYGPAKTWPVNRFRELVNVLAEDIPVLVTGGPGDREVCGTVSRGLDGVYNAAGATSLGGLFALLERAAAVVANDSGTPHVSASLGTRTVVLFGSTAPEWTAPMGQDVRVLRHPVHCSPCFRRTCPTQLECFHGIAVADVVEALGDLKKGVAERPARG